MFLHVPTLMTALILGYALLTLALVTAQPSLRQRPEVRSWTRGNLAMLAGLALLVARGWLPEWWSVLLGNGGVGLALALYHQALHLQLRGTPPGRGWWRVQPLAWALLAVVADWPMAPRTTAVSWLLAAWLTPTVMLLWRDGRRVERSLRTLALAAGLAWAALWLRGAHALQAPEQYLSLTQASLGQGLSFLVVFMSLLGVGFTFVLAVFERVAGQMEELASHDSLTGCLNRGTTDALLAHGLARARREGQPLAFALLDLDHFKRINDTHGHRMGDEVLRRFAQATRERLRGADVLGRTGGEEFGLLLPGTDEAGARRVLEEIRQAVAGLQVPNGAGPAVSVTVSVGVALGGGAQDLSADRLYGRADQALYEAKRNGRNRVEVYQDSRRRQGSLLDEEATAPSGPRQDLPAGQSHEPAGAQVPHGTVPVAAPAPGWPAVSS